jgi:hypothetical protein
MECNREIGKMTYETKGVATCGTEAGEKAQIALRHYFAIAVDERDA